jgi:hypothetical protein
VEVAEFDHVQEGDRNSGRSGKLEARRPKVPSGHVDVKKSDVLFCGEQQRLRGRRGGGEAGKMGNKRVGGSWGRCGVASGDKVGSKKRGGGERVGAECGDSGGQGRHGGHR